MKVISQDVQYDLGGCYLYTKYEDGSITSEPISSEEAATWQAEHKF